MEVRRREGAARRQPAATGGPVERAGLTRRALLGRAARLGVAASTLSALDALAWLPARAAAQTAALPDIQFSIAKYLAPAFTQERVRVRFGPVYTTFATLALERTPTKADQATLAKALAVVESAYPFTPAGVFTFVAYGIPYFERLPGGMAGSLVADHMPRLIGETQRYALEEAEPGPTDVSPLNPEVSKQTFDVPVQIEANDMLLTIRSDSAANIDDVLTWLTGASTTLAGASVGESGLAGLFTVTSRRLMFHQQGLPRALGEEHGLPYAASLNPKSPMWMGFVDQQVDATGPASVTTFVGNTSAKLTTARGGEYLDHGSIQHLSHVILDLEQFYARPKETYTRRVGYMFRSDPLPGTGYADQYTSGGGPAFVADPFTGPEDAEREAAGTGTYDGQGHLGHTNALRRTSRAPDRMPIHIRTDGPGFDSLDVPDGSSQPKLHFSIFVPSADFFRTMRRSQASQDLAQRYGVPSQNQGLERFITATRRQNFLVPPRRHRAFPLTELA
jgi:hypothetical protein